MAWDAGTMAASGCLSIRDWHGVYFITTSDHNPGLFGSIGEALKYDMISMPIPGLDLQSGVVPLETLPMLGLTLPGECDGEVTINDRCYVRGADGQLTEAADG